MRRYKVGIAVIASVFVVLAWTWTNGSESEDLAEPEPTSSDSGGPDEEDPREAVGTRSPEPSPVESPTPTEDPAEAEVATNTYGGPLGTRNHTGSNTVALTFDDGPSPEWTPRVLDQLRERGVKATFCVIGAYAEAYPELIADMVHDGHTLCNHSWFHEFKLGTWDKNKIRANLQRTNDAIERAAPGTRVPYFRHPGGQWTGRAISVAADLGMESLHWAVDPSDWNNARTEKQIRDHVLDRSEPGAIILLHDGAANQKDMYKALVAILDEYGRRGYALTAL